MRFSKKMFMAYSAFGIIISIIAGMIYIVISSSQFVSQKYQELMLTARQIAIQYEEMLDSMDDVSWYLLSDKDTLSAINNLTQVERTPNMNKYIEEGKGRIRLMMSTDYLNRKFYRVIYFNQSGDIIASNNWGSKIVKSTVSYESFPWFHKSEYNTGGIILYGVHKDEWGLVGDEDVLSVIKKIQGNRMGYIEVQKTEKEIKDFLNVPNQDMNILIFSGNGEYIYKDNSFLPKDFPMRTDIPAGKFLTDKGSIFAAGNYVEKYDSSVTVIMQAEQFYSGMEKIWVTASIIIFGMILLSLFYIIAVTYHLTEPIKKLQQIIQRTDLNNLDQPVRITEGDNEFAKVGKAYQEMGLRLKRSMIRQAQLSNLQLQAQFDLLQAQINPHFIYNVLNIISNRGIQDNDEIICDMCADLAGMLRYAANTKEKYATIHGELEYLKQFFSILKCRYEHKLEYTIEVESQIYDQTIPKIILQQLVENSIGHGFGNSSRKMEIEVRGWASNGDWYIRVRDTGEGFEQKILDELHQNIHFVRHELEKNEGNIKSEIGGMGIINTFARMYLLNGDNSIFIVRNWSDGAEVLIGGKLKTKMLSDNKKIL